MGGDLLGAGVFLLHLYIWSRRIWIGGGGTVRVRLHLPADAPKLFDTDPALALLLEETDSGFYVLRTTQGRSSLFLPRTIVKALEFNVPAGNSQSPNH